MAQTYSTIYAFGDSLSDAGNLSISTGAAGSPEPVAPPYYKVQYGPVAAHVFSNGPVWVQDLSTDLGLGTLSPSLAGGTDFAFGGAETGNTPQNGGGAAIGALSLPSQLSAFRGRVLFPSSDALYTVSIGSNDIFDILANPGLSAQQQAADINASVANEISFVKQLISGGAKNVLVLDVPDLGKTPTVTSGRANGSNTPSAALDTLASQLSASYDQALTSQLAAITGSNVQVVDAFQFIDNGIANASLYGLTNVTTPVWSGNYTSSSSGTLTSTDTATQDQSLFWDQLHPTETGHQALADQAVAQLTGTPVLKVADTTTGQPVAAEGHPYTGPVAGVQQQYINITADSLAITATTPNWFLHSGGGEDALAVSSGSNVLDGGTGSNFLTGGSGTDNFFVDDRAATATIWSTVTNLHGSDNVTVWGVTAADFSLSWSNGAGASGFTGLTLTALSATKPEALLTLAGFSQSDLTNGRLAVSFGTDAGSGSAFMYIHANT
jgi:phospholipase/lecithinase/hemolysin